MGNALYSGFTFPDKGVTISGFAATEFKETEFSFFCSSDFQQIFYSLNAAEFFAEQMVVYYEWGIN